MGAVSLSLLIHALLLIPILLTPLPDVNVEAAIEVSVAPPAPEPEAEAETEVPVEPPAETEQQTPVGGDLPRHKPPKARSDKSASSAALSTAAELAPSGARVVVLVRTARLRPHPDLIELSRAVMALLPDYHWAKQVGLDPVEDFSLLLVATANPYDVTETFVAALMEEEKAKNNSEPAPPGGADPRVVQRVPPDVLLLGKPDHLTAIGDAWAQKLHTAVKSKEGAVLEAKVARLRGNLAFEGIAMPLPERAAGRVFVAGEGPSKPSAGIGEVAGASPSLVLDLEYASAADAAEVAGMWPQIEARIGSSAVLAWMGLSDVAAGAAIEQDKSRVVLKLDLAPRHVRALSRVLGLLLGRMRGRVHGSGDL